MEENRSFYVNLESDLIYDNRLSDKTKIVYAVISNYSNNKNGFCYLNYLQLAEIVNLSKRQFYRCVNDLKEYNYITIIKKANRSYLMPVINKIQEKRNHPIMDIDKIDLFEYDWLNEE